MHDDQQWPIQRIYHIVADIPISPHAHGHPRSCITYLGNFLQLLQKSGVDNTLARVTAYILGSSFPSKHGCRDRVLT